jgi:hypothetical protein
VNRVLLGVACGVAAAAAGCADRPFLRADPPVTNGGVTVALAGQQCRRRVRHDQNGILDLVLAVSVTNAGLTPVTVDPAHLTLVVRGDASRPDDHDAPFTLAPGRSSLTRAHFHAWSDAKCTEPMTLTLEGVLPTPPRSLSFIPEASDT